MLSKKKKKSLRKPVEIDNQNLMVPIKEDNGLNQLITNQIPEPVDNEIFEENAEVIVNPDPVISGDEKSYSKWFGYDIFAQDPSLFQSTFNGVVDPSYTVGAGDEIILTLWGETEFRQVLKVNRGLCFHSQMSDKYL